MTATRPPFSRTDAPPTIGLFLLGVVISFGLSSAILILFHGLWILWPILLFMLMLQLCFEGAARLIWWGLRRVWYTLRDQPLPPAPSPTVRKPEPWLKSYAFLLGFLLGGSALLVSAWANGALSLSGGGP